MQITGSHPFAAASAGPRLVADIGGTHARYGWVTDSASGVQHVRTLAVQQYPRPADAAKAYLAEQAVLLGAGYRPPRRMAWAVATAVSGDAVSFLNSRWAFSCTELCAELALDRLVILNDFEALALALPHLQDSQLRRHPAPAGGWPALSGAARAVIGPGTGLGVAGVAPCGPGRWLALSSEGGHATLAPGDDFESALLAAARRQHPHVSAERLLSGIGLPLLHAGVAAVLGQPGAPALTSEQIVARGSDGSDALCRQTLDTFCALLGSFAGNVALTFGARGGLYIGGGIVPRIAELFFASRFRERFEAKGRLAGYLAQIPTALITDTLAALTGAAAALDDAD